MDAASVDDAGAGAAETRWLLLIFHLAREPSRHRVAVWRGLKYLGAGSSAMPPPSMLTEPEGDLA